MLHDRNTPVPDQDCVAVAAMTRNTLTAYLDASGDPEKQHDVLRDWIMRGRRQLGADHDLLSIYNALAAYLPMRPSGHPLETDICRQIARSNAVRDALEAMIPGLRTADTVYIRRLHNAALRRFDAANGAMSATQAVTRAFKTVPPPTQV